ncbi:MAG: tRNA (adenosine(37)-N6)-threonylcarbamoyltransferase complex ATPase subunit type 1 TsaE [Caldilineaceae bacterium]
MKEQTQSANTLTLTLDTTTPEATRTIGQQLGQLLKHGQVIALRGDLGAGKTVLTQGISAGLGVTARVTSPTFTLVNQYRTPDKRELVHIDSYRLGEGNAAAEAEAATLGLEDILAEEKAIVVIEWAERVAALLPPDHLAIHLAYGDQVATTRHITLTATGPLSAELLKALADTLS